MTTGRIHSFESFGAADGPGVRFIVFLSGCPFRCVYCHNPDTWARSAAMELSPDEVFKKALRYRAYWGDKGGITVSGGEPMLQAEFVTELFLQAHAAGINTCLDTAAACWTGSEAQRALLAATDTVLLDIKHIDPRKHREITGADNRQVLDCAQYLADIDKPTWVRHVLVPGLTDDEMSLKALADFISSLGNVKRVDVLPYHTLGVAKWHELGISYSLEGVEPPTTEVLAAVQSFFSFSPLSH